MDANIVPELLFTAFSSVQSSQSVRQCVLSRIDPRLSSLISTSTGRRTASIVEMKPSELVRKLCKKKCDSQLFLFEHSKPVDFIHSQWQHKQEVTGYYLMYRWLVAVYFIVTMTFSVLDLGRESTYHMRVKWPVYFTNWGYAVCMVQALLGACLVSSRYDDEKRNDFCPVISRMTASFQVYWILHTVGTVAAFGVTGYYWVAIYKPGESVLDAISLLGHVCNSVVMLVDLFVVKHPFRIHHFYLPFFFFLMYLLFTLVYHFTGGTNREDKPYVYSLMDWSVPQRALLGCLIGLTASLLLHSLSYFLYLLKVRIYLKVHKNTEESFLV